MRWFGNFLLGTLVGGIVGAVTVLLLAPGSGSETRNRITSYAHDIEDQVRQAAVTRRQEMQLELDSLRR
jgi:gas vesicle protein